MHTILDSSTDDHALHDDRNIGYTKQRCYTIIFTSQVTNDIVGQRKVRRLAAAAAWTDLLFQLG